MSCKKKSKLSLWHVITGSIPNLSVRRGALSMLTMLFWQGESPFSELHGHEDFTGTLPMLQQTNCKFKS